MLTGKLSQLLHHSTGLRVPGHGEPLAGAAMDVPN